MSLEERDLIPTIHTGDGIRQKLPKAATRTLGRTFLWLFGRAGPSLIEDRPSQSSVTRVLVWHSQRS